MLKSWRCELRGHRPADRHPGGGSHRPGGPDQACLFGFVGYGHRRRGPVPRPRASVCDQVRHRSRVRRLRGVAGGSRDRRRLQPAAERLARTVDEGGAFRWEARPVQEAVHGERGGGAGDAGGATMDAGCYAVHMARVFGGETPAVVSASAKLRSPSVDRAMTAELAYPSGHTGRVECSMWSSSVLKISAKVLGSQGSLPAFNPLMSANPAEPGRPRGRPDLGHHRAASARTHSPAVPHPEQPGAGRTLKPPRSCRSGSATPGS